MQIERKAVKPNVRRISSLIVSAGGVVEKKELGNVSRAHWHSSLTELTLP